MAQIIPDKVFGDLVEEGFFDEMKNINDVAHKLEQRGYSIPTSKYGRIAQRLTQLCQEGKLERYPVLENKQTKGGGKWHYKKR